MAAGIGQYGFGAKMHRYADAGKYFTATNPTAGTGIISGVVATLADTTPYLLFKNNNTVGSGIKCYFDFLQLIVSAVSASNTRLDLAVRTDSSQSTTRYSSGGTQITPVNVNADSVIASAVTMYAGAITAAAAGSARHLSHLVLREVISVVQDTYTILFGNIEAGVVGVNTTAGTGVVHRTFGHVPVVVGPQQHALVHIYGAGMAVTGLTLEFNLGYIET